MAEKNTILQLALVKADTVPFPGCEAVLKGKEKASSANTKIMAVQNLLGLKTGIITK